MSGSPYRDPGRELGAPKLPRVLCQAGDRRLVQVDADRFVIEKAMPDAMGILQWSRAWSLDPETAERAAFFSAMEFRESQFQQHARWLAQQIARLA